MRIFAILLVFLLLSGTKSADFSIKTISVFIDINIDGSANVEERFDIIMNGTSRELYETTRMAYLDLATWREKTKLSELRQHISGAKAEITGLMVTPQAVEKCITYLGTCHAIFIINYKVVGNQNGSGLIQVERYKPRTAKYSIQQKALSFEQTEQGDLILPKGTSITISIPASAEKIYFSTAPSNTADEGVESFRYDPSANLRYYIGNKRAFTWSDTSSQFRFTFEIEGPLESEVMEFFSSMRGTISQILLGKEGPAALAIIAAGALTFYYFGRIGRR